MNVFYQWFYVNVIVFMYNNKYNFLKSNDLTIYDNFNTDIYKFGDTLSDVMLII